MKKLLLLAAVAGLMATANAQTVTVTGTKYQPKYTVEWAGAAQQKIDTFSKPIDIYRNYQQIYTVDYNSARNKKVDLPDWLVSCLVTPADFDGLINGVEGKHMPKWAELTQMFLQCYNIGSKESYGYTMDVSSWISDFPADTFSTEEQRRTYTDELARLQADTNTFPSLAHYKAEFKGFNGQGVNGKELEDFIQCDYENPYTFTGDHNLLVSVNMLGCSNMNFRYGTFKAANKKATIFRGKGTYYYTYDDGTVEKRMVQPTIIAQHDYYNVEDIVSTSTYGTPMPVNYGNLPAFGLKYYTNDIRGTITDDYGEAISGDTVLVSVKDATTGETVVAPQAVGSSFEFLNFNPADKYELTISTKNYGTAVVSDLYFDKNKDMAEAKKNDIVISMELRRVDEPTSVSTVEATKTVQSVRYYDLTGRQSAEPVSGINVKVVTYTDGTRTASKLAF